MHRKLTASKANHTCPSHSHFAWKSNCSMFSLSSSFICVSCWVRLFVCANFFPRGRCWCLWSWWGPGWRWGCWWTPDCTESDRMDLRCHRVRTWTPAISSSEVKSWYFIWRHSFAPQLFVARSIAMSIPWFPGWTTHMIQRNFHFFPPKSISRNTKLKNNWFSNSFQIIASYLILKDSQLFHHFFLLAEHLSLFFFQLSPSHLQLIDLCKQPHKSKRLIMSTCRNAPLCKTRRQCSKFLSATRRFAAKVDVTVTLEIYAANDGSVFPPTYR